MKAVASTLILAVSFAGSSFALAAPAATPLSEAPAATPSSSPQEPSGLEALGHQMKGYEIYSWQEPLGTWHFALLIGTNRLKSSEEIKAAAITERELRSRLERLPPREEMFWCVSRATPNMQPPLENPPRPIANSVRELAHRRGLQLFICDASKSTPAPTNPL